MELYPMTFKPILQDKIWGGTKLKTVLGKDSLPSGTTGESWELSAVPDNVSVVKNGNYAGLLLTDILAKYPEEVLGTKVHKKFGNQFPLLFKFIDAHKDLSIQVHPDDELAMRRHNSFGKTEMWYVMQADERSRIIVGFKENTSPEQYLEHLHNKNLPEILNQVEVKKGDVYFLETGTIHAIGGGILIAEIQQTSDITYRVYDWDRVDANGNLRELHVDEALEAMNYNVTNTRIEYHKQPNESNKIVECPYFTTNYLPLNGSIEVNNEGDSFNVYICTEGSYTINYNGGSFEFKKGDTVLIPAAMKAITLTGEATLLQIYIL